MIKPVMATAMGITAKMKRCRKKSEMIAMSMENANAHAHGGTEYNCVLMLLCPSPWMMVGAKYAGMVRFE